MYTLLVNSRVVAALLALGAALACPSSLTAEDPAATLSLMRPRPAKDAPDFQVRTPDDRTLSLGGLRGKVVFLNFWATWCEPCRDEFPTLVELAKQYAPEGLAVFGVSLDGDAEMNLVRRFLARHQPKFPNYRQKMGIDVDAFYRGVNPAWSGTMPETIFYSRDGRIAGHFVGGQTRAAFEAAIREILASPAAPAAAGKSAP